MDTKMRNTPPLFYWTVAVLLALWGFVGCYACYMQFLHGPDAMGPATTYDRQLYASLPAWYNYCYAVAVGTAMLGAIGLLLRASWSGIAFLISLIAAIVQFGYLFVFTDILMKKGPAVVLPFPIFIILVAFGAMCLAVYAYRRNWTS